MFFWFIGGAAFIVWNVFRDPSIDYRVLAIGALLPDVLDLPTRHRVAHSITVSIAFLVVLMVATIGRRALRKRLLMIPIGMFLHLVLDGVFQSTRTFWWPITGTAAVRGDLPSVDRPVMLTVIFELIGLVVLRWFWRRASLSNPQQRASFLASGHLPIP
jgi:hypothetical protein